MVFGTTVLNFGAGPAKLPQEVLIEVKHELLNFQDSQMSVMEMSHRGKEYTKINNDAQKAIRELLKVPDNYKIIFMQGGGTGLFAAVALNLMNRTGTADYAVTGSWSAKAAKEAAKYGEVKLVFPKSDKPGSIPDPSTWKLNPNASYFYYCANETIDGVEFPYIPETNGVPIVADMSSNIMTRPLDVSKFGIIYAGAQKNIGTAGITMVIIREDLLGKPMPICPTILDFTIIAKNNSVYNTPPTFTVYVMERVFNWIKRNGGIAEMESRAIRKSSLLYDTIKRSNGFYCCPVDDGVRSRMNVPFRVGGPNGDEELEEKFLKEAEALKMYQLKGHRLVGGIRASIYNAVSFNDVQILVDFMIQFHKENSYNKTQQLNC